MVAGNRSAPFQVESATFTRTLSGAARTFSAAQLEAGADEIDGALGDGAGKWRLTGTQPASRRECAMETGMTIGTGAG